MLDYLRAIKLRNLRLLLIHRVEAKLHRKSKRWQSCCKTKNPTKEGFEFGYWYLVEGSEYDFQTPVTSNITLKALWDGGEYTVTFDTDGGSSIAPVVVAANGKVTKPEDPTKDGFKFNFWTKDGAEFSFDTPITGNITLKANWTELSVADQIEEDYQAVLANFVVSSVQVNTPTKGQFTGHVLHGTQQHHMFQTQELFYHYYTDKIQQQLHFQQLLELEPKELKKILMLN